MWNKKKWYRRFKWKNNPFSIKVNSEIFVGLTEERKTLASLVEGGNICLLIGDNGVGKSSLLRWLETRIKNFTILYINSEWVKNDFDPDVWLKKQASFFRSYPKNIVLLIDEAQKLDNRLRIDVQAMWEQGIVKSIVFSHDGEAKYESLPTQLKSRIGNRVIRIKKLKKEDAYDLIRLRSGGKNPFDANAMDEIIKRSNGIPRKVLELCERVCILTDKDAISKYEVIRILGDMPEINLK